jgi:hypothetical protein
MRKELVTCPDCKKDRHIIITKNRPSTGLCQSCYLARQSIPAKKRLLLQKKVCATCKVEKSFSGFTNNNANADGKSSICRDCKIEENKKFGRCLKWRLEHPDRCRAYKENQKQKRRENPVKYLLESAKRSAKERGLSFNLEASDLIIPQFCPVLGIQLSMDDGRDNLPSVDRFDSTAGYKKGNISIISFRANRIKNDATVDELQKIAAWAKAFNEK